MNALCGRSIAWFKRAGIGLIAACTVLTALTVVRRGASRREQPGGPSDTAANRSTVVQNPRTRPLNSHRDAGSPGPSTPNASERQPDSPASSPAESSDPPHAAVPGFPSNAGEGRNILAWLRQDAVPIAERRAGITALAERRDAMAASVLMALGSDGSYLSDAAITALGRIEGNEAVKAYLRTQLTAADPRVARAAIDSLAQVGGSRAAADIGNALYENQSRKDGFDDMVCAAAIDALGYLGSRESIPYLEQALARTMEGRHSYEQGSRIVEALKRIADPAGVTVLRSYRQHISECMDRATNSSMARHYLQAKLNEIDTASAAIGEEND